MSATDTATLPDYAPIPSRLSGRPSTSRATTSAESSGTSTTSPTAPTCRRS